MESLKTQEKTKKRRLHFYCYICEKNFTKKMPLINEENQSEILCTQCHNNFVEKIPSLTTEFTPYKIPFYQMNKTKNEIREEQPNHRIIEKTVRMSNSSPYVQDVLMEIFPQVFQRASINRIRTIRNILNTLNIMDFETESDNGPTDEHYVKKLPKMSFEELEDTHKEKSKNCPICTENFENKDLIIKLECNHFFHDYCILPWLNLHNSCPNCRFVFPKKLSL